MNDQTSTFSSSSPDPADGAAPIAPLDARPASRRGGPWRVAYAHLRRRKIAMVCFAILVAYFGITIASYVPGLSGLFDELATRRLVGPDDVPLEYVAPRLSAPDMTQFEGRDYEPADRAVWEAREGRPAVPASGFHFILGTDVQGRSVFWLTLYGARTSMSIALGASILVVLIGTILGALAGYLGGALDVFITWLFTTVASIPRILLVLAMAYAFRDYEFTLFGLIEPTRMPGVLMLILAMGLTTWVGLCRLIRGEVMKLKELDFESAARAIGVGRLRILGRHLLPNVTYLIIIQFSLTFPLFIHLEVILTYLGLGGDIKVSWGQMIDASLQEMMRSPVVWWQLTAATIAVFGISLALNLFGDALRDALDPRLQQSQ